MNLRTATLMLIAIWTSQSAPAEELRPTVLQFGGVIDMVEGTDQVELDSPFVLTVSILGEVPLHSMYQAPNGDGVLVSYADAIFDTDVQLQAGHFEQRWSSQFGAMSMSSSDVGSDLLLDLGSDFNALISKRGDEGLSSLDFAGAIDFLSDGEVDPLSLFFILDISGAAGSFGGTITSIELLSPPAASASVPEPTSLALACFAMMAFALLVGRRAGRL